MRSPCSGLATPILVAALVTASCGGQLSPTGPVPSSGTTAPASGPTLTLPPERPFDGANLASAVIGATSDDAQAVAVIDVLRAIHVGVFTQNGAPIVVGAERSSDDVWVYDFEVAAWVLTLYRARRTVAKKEILT